MSYSMIKPSSSNYDYGTSTGYGGSGGGGGGYGGYSGSYVYDNKSLADSFNSIYSTKSKTDNLCREYLEKTLNGTFSGPLKADGTPDYRFAANRIPGIKKDGTPDMRYKMNRRW